MSKTTPEPVSMTAADIKAAALALVPKIEARSDEIAELRGLPPDLLDSLKAAGAFRMQMPRDWGGPEMTLREQSEVIEIYARADPSVGWCVMIGADSGFFASFLDEGPARELFPDLDHSIAGAGSPMGRADRVPGGYRINGRMPFASNVNNAEIATSICPVYDGEDLAFVDGRPQMIMSFLPTEKVQIIDSWHTLGLAGSSSNDYHVDDVFVPEAHTFEFGFDRSNQPGPLYAWMGMIQANMHAVPLGLARRAIDIVKKLAGEKRQPNATRMGESLLLKEIPRVRTNMARAEMMLGAARAYSYESMDRVWDEICRDGVPGREARFALHASRSLAFRTARDIAQLMVDTVGASAIYRTSPLERLLRDSVTMSQHWTAQERTLDTIGALALGDDLHMPGL